MLTQDQIDQFKELGYLFLPREFSQEEVNVLSRELPGVFAQDRPEVWREKGGDVVRTAFAAHHYNEAFRLLAHHPRMVSPSMELLGGPVYVHQYKINAKAAFDGDVWQWHQDYGTWARDDLMPEPRAMNIAVFVDEVTEFNGPLMLIPKSHKRGVLQAGHDLATTSYPLWTLDKDTITRLVEEGGLVAPKGPPGSVLMFHCNLVHASPGNISPWRRTIVYISVCHVDNHIRRFQREEWIAHRDFTSLECEEDDCLIEYGRRMQSAS
jgi:ectoine hydroxylase